MDKKELRRYFGIGLAVGLSLALIICAVAGGIAYKKLFTGGTLGKSVSTKVDYIYHMIKNYGFYEELEDVDFETGIYDGVVDALGDKYADYFTVEEYAEQMQDLGGSFAGIGATLSKDADTGIVTIINVYDDSPAQKAGLKSGDVISSADGYDALDYDLDGFVSHVRGEIGTPVELEIIRDGEELHFSIIRDTIDVTTVTGEMLPGTNIGYINITSFKENTSDQLDKVYRELEAQGMKAIVYDVRSNPGGLLNSVVDILDTILPEGLVCYEMDYTGTRTDYNSDEAHMEYPMVVLTSQYSASGAELFSQALQDYGYATILGTTTYGKGIVQNTYRLYDGSALKITVAKYYGPNGTCLHGEGVTPDIELEYEFLGGEEDEYAYEFDNQIQKAIEILSK